MLEIKNHQLQESVEYVPAQWMGGEITPKIAIVHDTASRLDLYNARDYLAKNNAKVSVHIVVERDGEIAQLVPFNRRANHAGVSTYHGRRNCNDFSIGIEIVNPGKMSVGPIPGTSRTWFGQVFPNTEYEIQRVITPEHGDGWWMAYPTEQIVSVMKVLEAITAEYGLTDIQPHWYVSPGRKVDTNPLFPLEHIRSRILGRDEIEQQRADEIAGPKVDQRMIVWTKANLNMRRWPSFNPNVIAVIPAYTQLPVINTGTFDGMAWEKVIYDGQEGWVLGAYTTNKDPSLH